ncbi:hypothetical protein MS5202_33320 [Klebsiella pneumoniae]|nr:hypothetical protein MS5202_33320 [Klebsiella pneumoniae]
MTPVSARWRLAPYRAYCLTGPGISGIPRGAISPPQARARAAPPGGIVGAVVALAGGGQALSAREGAVPSADFIRLAQNIARSEIATVMPR